MSEYSDIVEHVYRYNNYGSYKNRNRGCCYH